MPEVLPFRGLRYAASRPTTLSRLIAPPYDVISSAQRQELWARDAHNVVHLILDEAGAGLDAPDWYERAASSLQAWIADGTLRTDRNPAIYALEQSFTGPDGRPRVRRAVLGACRLHPYEDRVVLPHEKTLAAPRVDRLALLHHVRTNLSPVFGLYEDERAEVQGLVISLIAGAGELLSEAESDDGIQHRLWRVTEPSAYAPLLAALAPRKVLLADGHHRYDAALAYQDLVDREEPGLPPRAGHRFVLMALCSMADPGLFVYPTHRLVHHLADLRPAAFLEALRRYFVVDTLEEDMRRPAGRAWAVSKLAEHSGKSTTFLMVAAWDGKGRILTLREDADLAGLPLPASDALRELDVTVLHAVVLQHLLGISPTAQELGENVRYEMDAGEVVARTLSGECQLGFLLNPTPLWQVEAVAEAGEAMPQKSTFFYPKVATGLLLRRTDEDVGR